MVKYYKKKEIDYEPIENYDSDSEEEDEDYPPDDLSSVLIKFVKKIDIITGIFIFILYIIVSTDCFQLYIIKELYPNAYDSKIDTITDTGMFINGMIISICYMIFDLYKNKI